MQQAQCIKLIICFVLNLNGNCLFTNFIPNVANNLKRMRKLTLIILTLLFIFSCKEIKQTENMSAKMDDLKVKNDSLIKVLSEKKPEKNYWFDAEYDGEKLINVSST